MTTLTAAPDIRGLDDDDLAGLYGAADDATRDAIVAEMARRDRNEAARRKRAGVAGDWESGAYQQMINAEAETRGNLVGRRGAAAGITDAWQLWSGPEARARAYATPELNAYWDQFPRVTITGWQQQIADGRRLVLEERDREAWDAGHLPLTVPDETPEEPADDEPVPGTSYADIVALDAEDLWDDMIPLADVTIVAAAGGTGKTFAMVDLAARVTTGSDMPDGTPGGPAGSVVIVSAEDDPSTVMVHRLRAAGADMRKVRDLSEVRGQLFTLPACLPALRQVIAALGDVRLVILDPLAGVSDISLTSVRAVRHLLLRPLQQLARETGVAIVCIHHLTKAGSIAGSRAIVDTPRRVLMIERDKDDPGIRIVRVEKTNGATAAPARYRLAGEGPATRVTWLKKATSGDAGDGAPAASGSVLDALRAAAGPLTGQQVAALTGLPYHSVRVELARLEQDGTVSSPSRGTYALAAPAEPPAGLPRAADSYQDAVDRARARVSERAAQLRAARN